MVYSTKTILIRTNIIRLCIVSHNVFHNLITRENKNTFIIHTSTITVSYVENIFVRFTLVYT